MWYNVIGYDSEGFTFVERMDVSRNKKEAIKYAKSILTDEEYIGSELCEVQVQDCDTGGVEWDGYVEDYR